MHACEMNHEGMFTSNELHRKSIVRLWIICYHLPTGSITFCLVYLQRNFNQRKRGKKIKPWYLAYLSRLGWPVHGGAGKGICWEILGCRTLLRSWHWVNQSVQPAVGISRAPSRGDWTAHSVSGISAPTLGPWPAKGHKGEGVGGFVCYI